MTRQVMRGLVRDAVRRYSDMTWTDTEINAYLNEAQSVFCMNSHCLRKHGTITITASTGIQSLPNDCLLIFRAEWDGALVKTKSTRDMDLDYGDNWRTNTGTEIEIIIPDNEEDGKFRIYPILGTADIGTTTLAIDYSYLPSDVSTDSASPTILVKYHPALVYYAIYKCLETNTQSDQNPIMGDRYYDRFMDYVNMARSEKISGSVINPDRRVRARNFV